jgi:hypothetical protein
MRACENCGVEIVGKGVMYGRFCCTRCYRTAWMRAKHRADPQGYREEMRRRREDADFMERQRESNRASARRNRQRIAARQRQWYADNREKAAAEATARQAVRTGQLVREPCLFCEKPTVHAHHHDYTKPLDVTWLCKDHHGLVHRKNEIPDVG